MVNAGGCPLLGNLLFLEIRRHARKSICFITLTMQIA